MRPPLRAVARRLALLLVPVLLLSGCAGSPLAIYQGARSPACDYQGQAGTPVIVLEAQAVPSASLLPCLKLTPAGWTISDVFVQNGRARFSLDSDRVGARALTVVLERVCRLPEQATRVPSDEPGTRRYEHIGPVRPGVGFTGTRYYLFRTACVTYQFKFTGEERAGAIGEVDLALSFISREAVAAEIGKRTGGRANLDPPAR